MKSTSIFIMIFFTVLSAQDNLGGDPYSLNHNMRENTATILTEAVDRDLMLAEDALRPINSPYRYGKKFEVNYNFFDYAQKDIVDDGYEVWRLDIRSHNALAMSLEFMPFYLSDDALLYMYDEDLTNVLGAYSSINNEDHGEFSIPLLRGDVIHIELLIPQNSHDGNNIIISSIIHDYRDALNLWGNYESDRDCGDNVNCSSATDYQDPVNAAAYIDMGGYICSGSMINNTNNDLTPYFLTAWHCIDGSNVNVFRFYFNYETSSCSGNNANYGSYAYSSDLLVTSGDMDPDFALLLIDDDIYASWNVFYAGWDRSSSTPTISCGVHHPGGAPKKINFDNDTAYSSGPINWGDVGTSPSGSHWEVSWDDGGTEGGSSGSPLFDSNQRIVGQLSGGSGACGQGSDSYGKLYRAFSTTNIENWLCPGNSCPNAIDGIYTAGESDYITVTDPNGGETLDVGSEFDITWESNSSSNVSIKLYVNSTFNSTIAANTINDGSYAWNIPSSIASGSNYKIKITSNTNSSVYDFSDGTFSILSPSVDLNIGNVNVNSGVISIDIVNQIAVSGFQFTLSDYPDYITITGVGGGLAGSYGFTSSANASGTIVGFSLSGAQIPVGSGTLIDIYFDIDNPGGVTSLCLEDVIISDPLGSALGVDIGDCQEINLNPSVDLNIGDIDVNSGIISIDLTNQIAVSGFQFALSDYPDYISITGAGGGLAGSYGFSTSTNESGTIIGFSLSGAQIPVGNGTLIDIYFDTDNPDGMTSLCLEDVIISDPSGVALGVNIGDCQEIELLSIILGDMNFDGSLDVLDVVSLVNIILNSEDVSPSEFIAADINEDASINVMDVVLLVNLIIGD